MASVTPDVTADVKTLSVFIRRMFPHDAFPDALYERCAAGLIEAGGNDPRLGAQLAQGTAELAGTGFADLDADAALAYLHEISGSAFFQAVRGDTVVRLYDDHEVWALLDYDTNSFAAGGWIDRGFADLDWLPAARIEESS